MLNEEKRRRIARKFLEENFGKKGLNPIPKPLIAELAKSEKSAEILDTVARMFAHDFELWKVYDGMDALNEARAFEVMYAPYASSADQHFIAVSETKKELDEIVNEVFPEDRNEGWFIEYERYGNYYIAYD